jgi:hypothetical protein
MSFFIFFFHLQNCFSGALSGICRRTDPNQNRPRKVAIIEMLMAAAILTWAAEEASVQAAADAAARKVRKLGQLQPFTAVFP